MFAPLRRSDAKPAPERGTALLQSIVGRGVTVRGDLEFDGELTIRGRVVGRIAARRLVIAADGCFEGDAVARDAVVEGRLDGRIFAPTVEILGTAVIRGRIFHTTVTVGRGARIDGRMPWRPVSYFETLDRLPEAQP